MLFYESFYKFNGVRPVDDLFGFGVFQGIRRIGARNKALEPVKELVMYWRQSMPRIGGKKLYLMIKPELQERGIKLGRDCFLII